MWKRHVRVPLFFGRLDGSVTSSGLRIITVSSLLRAFSRRRYWVSVSTSLGFVSVPEPTTIMSAGTVTA